jgi:quercetin dioxygenase-like cupin family protein
LLRLSGPVSVHVTGRPPHEAAGGVRTRFTTRFLSGAELVILSNVCDAAVFDSRRFNAVTLAETPHSKTMLVCLEAGQSIPVHSPGIDMTLTVLEGRATLVAGQEELAGAGPGATVQAAARQRRGIRAEVRTLALVIVSPPPTAEDHREVAEHLKRGTWR